MSQRGKIMVIMCFTIAFLILFGVLGARSTGVSAHNATSRPAQHCIAVNNNPWCYNFVTPGKLIYRPNAAFCNYFRCVSTFWTANRGYVAECGNGKYTHSDGVRGACSRDGGVAKVLYSH